MSDAPDDPRRDAVLADLRRASARVRSWQADIDAIGLCLSGGLITTQRALEEMRDLGLPILMDPLTSPAAARAARAA